MSLNKYDSESHAITRLKEQGYTEDFVLDGKKMRNTNTGNLYATDDMIVDEFHRFEGVSNPDDMSIVFAVRCKDDTKGTVVSAYGLYADDELTKFMDAVPLHDQADMIS